MLTATAACANWLAPGNAVAYRFWYFFPPFRLGEFLLGIVAAQALRLGVGSGFMDVQANSLAVAAFVAVIGAAAFCNPVILRLVGAFALPILLIALVVSKGWLARMMSFGPLVLLGEASFGLYLIQVPTHDFYGWLQRFGWLPDVATYQGFTVYALFAIGVSLIVHVHFERKMATIVKRAWHHHREGRLLSRSV